jgi:hypothetical protein
MVVFLFEFQIRQTPQLYSVSDTPRYWMLSFVVHAVTTVL